MSSDSKNRVKVAIVGVGNCSNSLIQGVHYYRKAKENEDIPGLMHVKVGKYHIKDIEFTAGFDVDKEKIGKDLSEAIWAGQNDTYKFADVPKIAAKVYKGKTLDGLGTYLKEKIKESQAKTADVVKILKNTNTDVVVNYLPVGSEKATRWYAEKALQAGCAFVNCVPVFLASDKKWQKKFAKKKIPIIGDDIKSQVGATIVHRVLTRLFADRGVRLQRTSQLNVGGNMDFYNMLDRSRLESKKISKTNAVTSQIDYKLEKDNIYIGPSDYIPWLTDRKWAHIRLEGKAFGDVPLNVELKLEVWDSPNSAGVVIDAIRCAKIALDKKLSGALVAPSSYFMKTPPKQFTDDTARQKTEDFINGENEETLKG